MPTLIVHTDSEPGESVRLLLERVGVWLTTRGVRHQVIPLDSPELPAQAIKARAVIGVGSGRDGGVTPLTGFLRQLPENGLAGKGFLWISTDAQGAAGDERLGSFWFALQRAGVTLLLRPVQLEDALSDGSDLSDRDGRRLSAGMIALVESLDFCRRLKQQQTSLELAERFAIAPLLA